MHVLLTAIILPASFIIYKFISFIRNIRLAKATGLPYTYSPVLEFESYAYFTTPILRYICSSYLKKNRRWPRWAQFMIKDWSWEDKRHTHEKYGEVFLVVAPGGLACYSSDARMVMDIMLRRNDFTKPPDLYKILEPYGPNVTSSEGNLWRFHIRITAPSFSDASGVNELVWNETLWQTQRLSSAWSLHGSRELHLDVHSLTLGVISRAGFGKRLDWVDNSVDSGKIPHGHELSFLKALTDTMKWILPILLVPGWILNSTPWKDAHIAQKELDAYLREMITSEKESLRKNLDYQSVNSKGNLLTAVMKASAFEARDSNKVDDGSKKETFTDDEVMGNLFVFLVAGKFRSIHQNADLLSYASIQMCSSTHPTRPGYETTANAIIYALIVLTLREDLQTQLIEEIDRVYEEAEKEGRQELSFTEDFDKFKFTYAFMYEILRVFPIVVQLIKLVTQPQRIITSDIDGNDAGTYVLPSGTRVFLNSSGIHYHEKYWHDPYKIDPSRWMADTATRLGDEKSPNKISAANKINQLKGKFLTFSGGPRVCLGRKFAQTEFVAFFARLLRDYRVQLKEGLSHEEVENDLYARGAGIITLSPLLVDNVKFRLDRRQH